MADAGTLASHQPRPARDVAHALERGGVVICRSSPAVTNLSSDCRDLWEFIPGVVG